MYQLIYRNTKGTKITIEDSELEIALSTLNKSQGLRQEDSIKGDIYTIFWPDLSPQQVLLEHQI